MASPFDIPELERATSLSVQFVLHFRMFHFVARTFFFLHNVRKRWWVKSCLEADSEMDIFNKISSHRAGMLEIPTSFSPALGDFVDRLLHHDPE